VSNYASPWANEGQDFAEDPSAKAFGVYEHKVNGKPTANRAAAHPLRRSSTKRPPVRAAVLSGEQGSSLLELIYRFTAR
jgi:hypothetical protein